MSCRYKRRKKLRKLSKRKASLSLSESDLNVDNTNSEGDDNLPLSAFMNKKKTAKKLKKHERSYKSSRHSSYPSASYSAKDYSRKEAERVPQFELENPNLPSCSKYSSDSSSTQHSRRSRSSKDRSKDQNGENGQVNEDSSGSANLPTCSKYTYSPYYSSQEGSNSSNLNVTKSSEWETSNEEDYPLTHRVKSEVRDVRPEEKNGGPSVSSSGSNNGRLRNILIKKEESSNTWYSYPCHYDSDSSEN